MDTTTTNISFRVYRQIDLKHQRRRMSSTTHLTSTYFLLITLIFAIVTNGTIASTVSSSAETTTTSNTTTSITSTTTTITPTIIPTTTTTSTSTTPTTTTTTATTTSTSPSPLPPPSTESTSTTATLLTSVSTSATSSPPSSTTTMTNTTIPTMTLTETTAEAPGSSPTNSEEITATVSTATSTSTTAELTNSSSPATMSEAVSSPATKSSTTTTSVTSPSRPNSSTESNTHTGLIVGVVVGVGGFLIICTIIIVVVILLKCRNKDPNHGSLKNGDIEFRQYQTDTLDPPHVVPPKPVPERPVQVKNFLKHVVEHQLRMKLYQDEFESLPDSRVKSRLVASDPSYAEENRYTNILPYDVNRVILEFKNSTATDYINASYINGFDGETIAYVAAQGPLDKTVNQFWQMVWQLKSDRIAMVTNLIEDYKLKCAQYWPQRVMEPMNCGEVTIKLIEEQVARLFTTRQITVHKDGHEDRQVWLYHFTVWPDHGVPETCTSLLKFYRLVFKPEIPLVKPYAPVIVHCSAGVGRSGTLISLDLILRTAEKHGYIDIPKCVEGLRLQRMWMVQTLAQYVYLHHAVLEWLLVGDVTIPCSSQFGDAVEELCKTNAESGKSRLQMQFEVLDALRPKLPEGMFSVAMREENMRRNRLPSALPADHNCLSLIEVEEDDNTYINAVVTPVYDQLKAFISTQCPLATTSSDFWRLVKDHNCVAIIMLNDLDTSSNNNSERYWPTDGRSTMTGRFTVTNTGPEITSDNVLVTPLQIVYEGKVKEGRRGMLPRASMGDGDDTDDSDDEDGNDGDKTSLTDDRQPPANVDPVYDNIAQRTDELAKAMIVQHIRVLNWANDSEFPKDMSTMLTLHSKVADCLRQNPKGRIVVHCLNGAERSGLFFAMMSILGGMLAEQEVDVFNAVKRIRNARPEFVTNLTQYRYLYELARYQQVTSRSIPEPEVDYPIYANSSAL